jgi:signal transduction histidine kinase
MHANPLDALGDQLRHALRATRVRLTTERAACTAEPPGGRLALDFDLPARRELEVCVWDPGRCRRIAATTRARRSSSTAASAARWKWSATIRSPARSARRCASVTIGCQTNLHETFCTAARLLVPFFADASTIDAIVGVDALQRIADSSWGDTTAQVEGLPALVREVARDHGGRVRHAPGDVSYLAVPIVRRGVIFAVLACVAGPRRLHADDDLRFASEYARRIAAAVGPGPAQALAPGWRPNDALLAILAHELRTPVTAVLGWACLLQTGHPTSAMAVRALAAIQRSAETQVRLVSDTFDLSRILMGTYRLHLASLDLAGVVERALEAGEPSASARSIAIHAALFNERPAIAGDEVRLHQARTNLLTNSMKYTPPGGRIVVMLTVDEDEAPVIVADSGIGVDAAFLAHLFEPLQRTDGGDPAHHGIGISLALVKRIVELHGGPVDAASEGRGRGATFTVRLPRLPRRPAAHRSTRPIAEELAEHPDPELLAQLRLVVVPTRRHARAAARGARSARRRGAHGHVSRGRVEAAARARRIWSSAISDVRSARRCFAAWARRAPRRCRCWPSAAAAAATITCSSSPPDSSCTSTSRCAPTSSRAPSPCS